MTAKRKIERRLRTQATLDATIDLAQADAAKVRVMAYFRELFTGGYAELAYAEEWKYSAPPAHRRSLPS